MKNVTIDANALTQISRYASDLHSALDSLTEDYEATILKFVIGVGEISNRIIFEANALDVYLYTFEVSFSPHISGTWGFSRKFYEGVASEYIKIKNDPIFTELFTDREKPFSEFLDTLDDEDNTNG